MTLGGNVDKHVICKGKAKGKQKEKKFEKYFRLKRLKVMVNSMLEE